MVRIFEKTIREKLANLVQDDDFAQMLYASLCNKIWVNKNTGEKYSCSWRYAGGIVASMRCCGEDYMDFYCSGGEGQVNERVRKVLDDLGYIPTDYEDEEK